MNAEQIRALVNEGTPESSTLDFKREYYEAGDKGKVDFLKDVTAMANTDGGTILIGVTEVDGFATNFAEMSNEGFDKQKNRMAALLSTGTDPKLTVEINGVEIDQENFVVEIEVPKSWMGPHRAIHNNQSYFYMRTTHGNDPMDTRQIRQAILLSENVTERMRNFRSERVGKILSDDTPVPLVGTFRMIVHLIPRASITNGKVLDLKGIPRSSFVIGNPEWCLRPTFNFEGVLGGWAGNSGGTERAYYQTFRNGMVEYVRSYEVKVDTNGSMALEGDYAEKELVGSAWSFRETLNALGVNSQVFVAISLVGAGAVTLKSSHSSVRPLRNNVMQLPEVELDEIPENIRALREALALPIDVMWQASGFASSPRIDKSGNWLA